MPTVLYDQTNSGLESLVLNDPNFISIRVSDSKFDRNGILWIVTSLVERPLKSYDPTTDQWQSFSFSELIQSPIQDELGFGDIDVGDDGKIWIGSYSNGLIGFDTNTNEINNVSTEEQNMPAITTRAVAVDNNNQVWIGTDRGLRVLFNTSEFTTDATPSVNTIVI